jgi:hypothetical protein
MLGQHLRTALRAAHAGRWLAAQLTAGRGFSAAGFAAERPLRVCVVGSGPAGFYTADRVRSQRVRVCYTIMQPAPAPR